MGERKQAFTIEFVAKLLLDKGSYLRGPIQGHHYKGECPEGQAPEVSGDLPFQEGHAFPRKRFAC